MSEQLRPSAEFKAETIQDAEAKRTPEINVEAAQEALDKKGELAQEVIEKQAISTENVSVGEKAAPSTAHPQPTSYELKQLGYARSLTRIRKRLSPPDRLLSKIIHQPAIETTSEVASKTLARPSGLLGGSIFAFLGSTLLLLAARHYGFQYNYLVFALLFIGGFGLGMLLELGLFLVRRKKP